MIQLPYLQRHRTAYKQFNLGILPKHLLPIEVTPVKLPIAFNTLW